MAVFRVEKTKDFTVMSNFHLRDVELSLKAKRMLSLMLSLPEDWDYTTKGLACICKDGVDSITSALKELENHGHLTRQRTRYENGRLGDITYTIHEKPVDQKEKEELPEQEKPEQEKPKRENPRQVNPEQAELKQEKPAQLNTELSNTDGLNIYQSIYPAEPETATCHDGMDRMELADAYRQIICENIEYNILVERHGKQRMDETVELMLEAILSKRPYIRIAGDDFPREVVRSRFLVHCRRVIVQCCQQINLDTPYFCGVPVNTVKNVTEEAAKLLAERSKAENMNESEYIRFLLLNQSEHPRSRDLELEVMRLRNEINKIGVNVNQLVKNNHSHIYNEGDKMELKLQMQSIKDILTMLTDKFLC